jgi:hypothetical protein
MPNSKKASPNWAIASQLKSQTKKKLGLPFGVCIFIMLKPI